jgi:hypothetical protein
LPGVAFSPLLRFISLAKVGNSEKQKWLYAFNIAPLTSIERGELMKQPDGTTDIPYLPEHIEIKASSS